MNDPTSRDAYVNGACGHNVDLYQRITNLLKEHDAKDSLLAQSPLENLVTLPDKNSPSEELGSKIGAYKLLQKIGEGGMGIVYMAEQEEPVKRKVALKIIKLGMDTKSVVARFEAERQALALMDHPAIARVLDGGKTESGRPYFVMELVKGAPITEFADKNKLDARARLDLFTQVCRAVQSAHQKGIIHRDLKPSNILVTLHHGEPLPKIIDFGIAKATNQKLTEKTLFTNFAQMIGTPAYMSPEQAEVSSMDIDTRTDVYSLGVLLYELLTGTTPFPEKELLSNGYAEMQRIIAEQEPERPSLRMSTLVGEQQSIVTKNRAGDLPLLTKQLRGDLDWIIMKALEKDRTRRYDTANGLAEDVHRHLSDEPVLAAKPSFRYQLVKLYHRHKPAFAAAAGITLALVVGTVVATAQAIRANKAQYRERLAAMNEAELRVEAEDQRDRAIQAERDAQKAAQERLQYAYVGDMQTANEAYLRNDYAFVREILLKYQPSSPGESDVRDFAWRYLWNVSDDRSLRSRNLSAENLTLSNNQRWLAVTDNERQIHILGYPSLKPLATIPHSRCREAHPSSPSPLLT